MRFCRIYSREADKTTGVKCDQIGTLETYKSLNCYAIQEPLAGGAASNG